MEKFYPPELNKESFHCVHCDVYASQTWFLLYQTGNVSINNFRYSVCGHCYARSYWYEGRMVIPTHSPVPYPHSDMPNECKEVYDEARDIVGRSPKAGAALIRLALQKLMVHLGEKGDNINEDIASLVKKGLPVGIQQALDYCRVVGNNAVHPGELNLDDTPDIANSMFSMMNFIVDDRIAKPKALQELYGKLPAGAIAAIEKRDGKTS